MISSTIVYAKKDEAKRHISNRLGISKEKAGGAIDAYHEWVVNSLVRGKAVMLQGIGTFRVKIHRGGVAWDIKHKRKIPYDPRKIVRFRCSPTLKGKLPPLTREEETLINRKTQFRRAT